jgi:hypothetical protein
MENDIRKHTGENFGGNYSFQFAFTDDVQEMPDTFEGAIHHEVTMKAGTRWYAGYATEGSMQFKDEQQDNDHGGFHNKEFTGTVPKDRPEVAALFESIKNRKFILDIKDNNGQRKIVGRPEEPLYLKSALDSKNSVEMRNEYKFTFSGQGVEKSPFYSV